MNADPPFHAPVANNPRVALRRQLLQRESTFDGTDHRTELNQHAITGRLDDPPAMLGNERVGGGAMLAQCLRRADLVLPHQPRIARHIGGEDRCETAGLGHVASPTARRRPDRNSWQCSGLRHGRSLGTT